ncbi:MAG: VCBS repeat-containing protein [Geobacteraceae bacterium]|nr:VCBS repeat-containing protein [Geobacteraceae bacterium]
MKKAAILIAALLMMVLSGQAYGSKTIILKIGTRVNQGATPAVSQVGGIQTTISVPAGATPHLIEGTSVDVVWSGAAVSANGLIAGNYTAGEGGSGGTIRLAGGTAQGGDLSPFGFGEFAKIVFDVPDDSTVKDSDFTYSGSVDYAQLIFGADSSTTDLSSTVSIVTYKEKDYNGDSRADILWRNSATGENWVWYMNGTSLTGGGQLASVSGSNWNIVGVADFNSDGKPDILWRDSTNGENWLWYMDGSSIIGGGQLPSVSDHNLTIVGTGDFNNDGKQDIVWRNSSTNETWVWYMNGTILTGGTQLPPAPSAIWKIGGVCDFNGDGKPDILWRNPTNGENWVWYMDGSSIIGGGQLPTVSGATWDTVGVADYNGDGKPDIIWRDSQSGANWIWYIRDLTLTGGGQIPSVVSSDLSIVGH